MRLAMNLLHTECMSRYQAELSVVMDTRLMNDFRDMYPLLKRRKNSTLMQKCFYPA